MTAPDQDDTTPATPAADATPPDAAETEPATKFATFGAGCFWCVEAVFEELEGVVSVESGYSNGHTENPTYKQVCSGTTGYNEVTRIEYDPKRVSFAKLLEVFWKTHDPTTLNRQGADVGTQYRSGVYYHDDEQKRIAEELKQKLDESGAFSAPIVTEILAVERYVPAEAYHQDYYAQNPNQGYCRAVIAPKLDKFRKTFADYLKR
ncbi:MAG: peptide-methionine (S)-S-oxide reductase MsrA [Planctomycetota bacterium]|nr:peptide-methionine (S)-S-oxide reductase MsrA [Planctomycetota bacterium]